MSSEKKFRIQNGLDVAGEVFVNGINIVGADGVLNEASYQTAVQAMIDATVAQGVDQGSIGQAVDKAVSDLADAAPATLDTLNELAAALGDDANFATSMTNALNTKLNSANNLSDVADAAAARSNLGLGTAATAATTSFATAAQGAKADAAATASDLTALETQISSGVATLAQGAKADTAVQPEDFFTVADGTTTSYVANWSDPSWSYGASQGFSKSNDIVVDLRVSPSGYKVATYHEKTYISFNQSMQTSVRLYRPDGSVTQIYSSSYTNGSGEYWGPRDGSRVVSADITDTHIFIAYSMPSGAGYRVFSYDDTTVTDLYGHRGQSNLIHSDAHNDGKNVTIRSVGDQGHLVVFNGGKQYPHRAGIHNWMTQTDSSLYVPGYQFQEVDVHSESGWVFVSGYLASQGVTGQNVLTGQTIKLDPVATHNQEGYRLGVSVGSKYVVVSDVSGNDDVRVYEVGTQNIVASIPNKNGQSSNWGGAQLQNSDIATNGDLVIIGSPYGDNTTFYMFDMSSSSPTTHFETFGMSTAYSNGSGNTPPEVEISDNHEILVYGLKNATLALGPTSAVVTPNVDASTIASKVYVDNAVANADPDLSSYPTTTEMNTAISNVSVDLSGYSTTAEMNSAITAEVANVVDAAPAALDTLNELAAALGDDANFASTVTTSLASKASTSDLATKADSSAVANVETSISDIETYLGGGGSPAIESQLQIDVSETNGINRAIDFEDFVILFTENGRKLYNKNDLNTSLKTFSGQWYYDVCYDNVNKILGFAMGSNSGVAFYDVSDINNIGSSVYTHTASPRGSHNNSANHGKSLAFSNGKFFATTYDAINSPSVCFIYDASNITSTPTEMQSPYQSQGGSSAAAYAGNRSDSYDYWGYDIAAHDGYLYVTDQYYSMHQGNGGAVFIYDTSDMSFVYKYEIVDINQNVILTTDDYWILVQNAYKTNVYEKGTGNLIKSIFNKGGYWAEQVGDYIAVEDRDPQDNSLLVALQDMTDVTKDKIFLSGSISGNNGWSEGSGSNEKFNFINSTNGSATQQIDVFLVSSIGGFTLKSELESTLASKVYVDNAVANADVDLSAYSTTAEMNTAISNVSVDLSGYSTTTEMNSAITAEVANVVDAAPAALDTLNELAAALGDDANFASTVTTSLATKASQTDITSVREMLTGQDVELQVLVGGGWSEFSYASGTQQGHLSIFDLNNPTATPISLTIPTSGDGISGVTNPQIGHLRVIADSEVIVASGQEGSVVVWHLNDLENPMVLAWDSDVDPASNMFGKCLGISKGTSHDTILVGDPNEEGGSGSDGAIYAYHKTTGQYLGQFAPTGDPQYSGVGGQYYFGEAFEVVNDKLIIGVHLDDQGAYPNSGTLYSWNLDPATGVPTGSASRGYVESRRSGEYGAFTASHGDYFVSGLGPKFDGTTNTYDHETPWNGRVDVYHKDNINTPIATLTSGYSSDFWESPAEKTRIINQYAQWGSTPNPSTYTHDNGFGSKYSTCVLSDDWLIISHRQGMKEEEFTHWTTGPYTVDQDKGIVYVFQRTGDTSFSTTPTMILTGHQYGVDQFGTTITLKGNMLVVGNGLASEQNFHAIDLTSPSTAIEIPKSGYYFGMNAMVLKPDNAAWPGGPSSLSDLNTNEKSIISSINEIHSEIGVLSNAQPDLSAYSTTAEMNTAIANADIAVSSSDLDMNGNKVLFANVYSTLGDLPSASTYHGMFAHVHGTGKAYYAHAGNWVELADASSLLTQSDIDTAIANAEVDLSGYSTTAEMNSAITAEVANVVDAAPAALDTLNELAAALGDDANFASTVTASIATKADDAATTAALATKSDQTDLDTLESLIKGQDVVGTSILISAPYAEHSDGTQRAGQTYLYNTADTSSPVLTIESADPREWMTQGSNDKPYSTTINQYGFVAIGDHGYTGGGRVSIFNPDGSLLQNLLPSSPNSSLNENFGKTVVWSESGDRLFVAAKNEDSSSVGGDKVEGAIYAYTVNYWNDNQNLNFSVPTKLSPSRNFNVIGGNQWFGEDNSSIVSVGRKLYVGFLSYDGSTQNQGRVYIYNIDDLNASPTEIATQSNTHANSFGSSVAANSTHWAAVAYSGATGTPEVIHIFDSSNNQLIGTIQKPNIETNDNWISYIEMTDSHIISIGAGLSGLDNNGMYVWPLSSISSQPTYVARYGSSSDGFNVHAKSVSAKGNIILLGYHEFNDGNVNGQLHIYDVNDLSTPQKVLNQPFSTINGSKFGMSASIGYTMTSPAAALETVATEITPAINELRSEISALSGTDTSLTDSISANASAIAAETAARTAAIAAIPSTDLSDYSTTAEMNTAIANAEVDLSGYSTTTEMNSAITAEVANVVDAAPAALDTLNELAAALGDDANFASTVTTSLADKASQDDLTAETTRATSAETINNQAIAILQNQVSGISTSSGSTDIEMQANVDMATNKISNLGTPTSGTDAATKAYVDSGVAGVDLSGYTDTSGMTSEIATAKSEAISTASADATTKADQAEADAKAYADQVVAATVDAAPAALDTLNELAAALGDDANFASSVTSSIATKADDAATTAAIAAETAARTAAIAAIPATDLTPYSTTAEMNTALATKADASSVSSIEDFLNGNAGDGTPTVESTITSGTGNADWGQEVIVHDDVVLVRQDRNLYFYSPNDLVNHIGHFGMSRNHNFAYDPVTKILATGHHIGGNNASGHAKFYHLSEVIAGTGDYKLSQFVSIDTGATKDPQLGHSVAFADGKFYVSKHSNDYGATPAVYVWNASDIDAQSSSITVGNPVTVVTPTIISAPPAADPRGYWGREIAAAGNYLYVEDWFYSQVETNAGAIFIYNTSDNQLAATLECSNDVKYFVEATQNYYAVHWHGVSPTKTRVYQAGTNTLVAELYSVTQREHNLHEFGNNLAIGWVENPYDANGNHIGGDKGVAIYDTSDFSTEPTYIATGSENYTVSSAQKLYAHTGSDVQVYDVSSLGGFSLQNDLEALITANTSAISTETTARQAAIVTAKSEAVALAASDATTKADAAQAAAISTASADATSKADQAETDAKAYADQVVAATVDAAPNALNTLNELAAALGDDANFASTVTTSIATKADDAATTAALATKADDAATTSALATKADQTDLDTLETFVKGSSSTINVDNIDNGEMWIGNGPGPGHPGNQGGTVIVDASGMSPLRSGYTGSGMRLVPEKINFTKELTEPGEYTFTFTGPSSANGNIRIVAMTGWFDWTSATNSTWWTGSEFVEAFTVDSTYTHNASNYASGSYTFTVPADGAVLALYHDAPNGSWLYLSDLSLVKTVAAPTLETTSSTVIEGINELHTEIATLSGTDTTLTASITDNTAAITAETSARTTADSTLQSSIDSEVARATAAEGVLTTAVSDETSARTSADTTLQSNIDTVSGRVDTILNGSSTSLDTIVEVVSAFENADSDLQTLISSNAGSHATNATAISTETTRATTAESALQTAIDTEETARAQAISAEETARITFDASLQDQINALDTQETTSKSSLQLSIDNEVTRATTAEGVNAAAISAETTARTSAISAETTARESAVTSAISTASSDATTKADAAEADAIATASADATSKANAAQSAAVSTASSDATAKANAAQSAAEATASADATTKADAAQAAAAVDATTKSDAALVSAQTYADNAASTAVANVIDAAPASLDTLNELAAALGDDANFASTMTNSLATKANTADVATAAQGVKADSALQPGDAVSLTVDNSDKLGGQQSSHFRIDIYDINGNIVN